MPSPLKALFGAENGILQGPVRVTAPGIGFLQRWPHHVLLVEERSRARKMRS